MAARPKVTLKPPRALSIAMVRVGTQLLRVGRQPGAGRGLPLLAFNGIGGNIELVEPLARAMPRRELITFDVPGVGCSPQPRLPYRFSDVARLATGVLESYGHERSDVLGVSWGGAVAQQLAHNERARCRRLILCATAPGYAMMPARPGVLLRMATPRRLMSCAYARRIAGEIYGGDFRSDPAYLLGNRPPAFDILFWNSDTTRLPGQFHCDLLELLETNPYANAGCMKVGGLPIDLGRVKAGAYVIGGVTDHITPWRACYGTARLFGPEATFVLANAGHLQSLINPPGAPKAYFLAASASVEDADDWARRAQAHRTAGSWWPHWRNWIRQRSGELVDAPARPGSRRYRPLCPAPGEYVHMK